MPVSRCDGCGSLVKNPFFDGPELSRVYANYPSHECHYEPPAGEIDNLVEKVRRIERQVPGKGLLLEVGCGRGYFLHEARKRGWEARGLELEGSARQNLLPGLGEAVSFIRSEEEFGGLGRARYDVICSYQVFEHLLDPAAALARWGAALRPGGLLVVDTPNAGSLGSRIHGPAWVQHLRKEHFVLATERALRNLCRSNGLAPVAIRYGGSPPGFSRSFSSARAARKLFRFPSLTRVARSVVHRLGLGDNIEFMACKR